MEGRRQFIPATVPVVAVLSDGKKFPVIAWEVDELYPLVGWIMQDGCINLVSVELYDDAGRFLRYEYGDS